MERQAVYHTDFPTYESFDTNNGDEATIKKNVQTYLREHKDTYQIGDLFELENHSEHLYDLIQIVLEDGKYYSDIESFPINYPVKHRKFLPNVKYNTIMEILKTNEIWNPFINADGEEFRYSEKNNNERINIILSNYDDYVKLYKDYGLL
jgi:hypothetical protein